MIVVTYANENDERDQLQLKIENGETVNPEVEAKVLADDSPYEMIAVKSGDEEEVRFDAEYPDDAEEPEAYDTSVEETEEAV